LYTTHETGTNKEYTVYVYELTTSKY